MSSRKLFALLIVWFFLGVTATTSAFVAHTHLKKIKTVEQFSSVAIAPETGTSPPVSSVESPEQNSEHISLIAVGDIMMSRTVAKVIKQQKDIHYPFLKTREYLKTGDIVFGNLEAPITKGREVKVGEMSFRVNPGTEIALKDAGFTIVSLANNHSKNFGEKGLIDTFSYLKNSGIAYVGAGHEKEAYAPVYLEKKGIRFAFLAYNDHDVVPSSYRASGKRIGTAFMDVKRMVVGVQEAKKNADIVVVSMHSGTEYVVKPNKSQVSFARAAVDAGADLVIGHHPHVVQSMEIYKGKYIFYSLGNFVFDQMWSQDTREGLVVKFNFTKEGVHSFDLKPVLIHNFAQPEFILGKQAEKIIKRLDTRVP